MRTLQLALRYTPSVSSAAFSSSTAVDASRPEAKRAWRRREQFAKPQIQRFEKQSQKVWYAPTWKLADDEETLEQQDGPLMKRITTPRKWKYYNEVCCICYSLQVHVTLFKVVWPINYTISESGLSKAREVFYVEESVHMQPKKIYPACQLALRMRVAEAILQLKFHNTKVG